MKLNKAVYDNLKWVVQIFLPALGGLYFGLSDMWDLPNALQVVGTITIFTTFLGVILGISHAQYAKNNEPQAGFFQQVGVDADTGHPDLKVILNKLPSELVENDTVTFKIKKPEYPLDI